MKILSTQEWLESVSAQRFARLAYSTAWGACVEDPRLMRISFQDHLVHRGDGVFEAIKICAGRPYLWKQHWKRLQVSADFVGMDLPLQEAQVLGILEEMLEWDRRQLGVTRELQTGLLRMFISRGEGGFGVSPLDCSRTDLHLFLTDLKGPGPDILQRGVRICASRVPAKEASFARVKSCNYLPNVLMKKEALERGFDYAIGIDASGFVLESSTENLAWINSRGELAHPPWQGILAGTSLQRLVELVRDSRICPVLGESQLRWQDLKEMPEVFLVGTTLDVVPVGQVDDCPKSKFTQALAFRNLLQKDR